MNTDEHGSEFIDGIGDRLCLFGQQQSEPDFWKVFMNVRWQ